MRTIGRDSRTITIPIEMVRLLDWNDPDAYVVIRLMPDRRGVQVETVATEKNETREPDAAEPDTAAIAQAQAPDSAQTPGEAPAPSHNPGGTGNLPLSGSGSGSGYE